MELEDLLKMVTAPMDGPLPFRSELETEEGKKPPAEIRWLSVQSYFPPAQAMLLKSRNTIGQISNIGSNTGAFIGNTGGLPPRACNSTHCPTATSIRRSNPAVTI